MKGIGGIATAAGAAGLSTGRASASTTRHGIEFDTVLNVVDDLGFDPTGNESVHRKLEAAADDRTLLVFPEGEYFFADRAVTNYRTNFGMLGKGNVRFVAPENFNRRILFFDRGTGALFENIDIDLRAEGATPGLQVGGDDNVVVKNVEFVGQGIHPDSDPRGEGSGNPEVKKALYIVIRTPEGEGLVENVVARNKGLMGAYNRGKGRTGVWVGRHTLGTVTIRNCHFSGFPNNGLYTSRTPGVVQVEGGVFRNNDISQVRLGSEGSYVKNAVIEVDSEKSQSPNPEDALNQRGVRIESGSIDTAGVTVENCDIHIANAPNSSGGVVGAGPAGHFEVVDTRIRVDPSWTAGVYANTPSSGTYAPPKPHNVTVRNVSITGDSRGGQAIQINSRPNSLIEDCCVEHDGDRRRGVKLIDSDGSIVRRSTLNVTGEQVDLTSTDASVWGNSGSGSCPLPTMDANEETANTDIGDGSGEGSSRRISLRGTDDNLIDYELEVDGELTPVGQTVEKGELRSSTRASGAAGKWEDSYEFTGEITKLVVKGQGTMLYTGDRIKFYGNKTGGALDYTVVADGAWKRAADDWDYIKKQDGKVHVDGAIGGWYDEFGIKGELYEATIEGGLEMTIEGMN